VTLEIDLFRQRIIHDEEIRGTKLIDAGATSKSIPQVSLQDVRLIVTKSCERLRKEATLEQICRSDSLKQGIG